MKRINHLILYCITLLCVSCGSFGEGLLAGMSGMGGYGYAGGYTPSAYNSGGNMNYLLDPNYAMAQTMAQQNQYNQVFNSIAAQTVNQVNAKEEQEYQNFCKYNKKSDGSNYTKNEWRALVGAAIQESKGRTTSSSTTSSRNTNRSYSSSSSNSSICLKSSAADIAHCNGNGVCAKCNGKKKYYDTSYGVSHWVDPCVTCNGTGKCPSCHGTGRK